MWLKYDIDPFYQNSNVLLSNPKLSLDHPFIDAISVTQGASLSTDGVAWNSDVDIVRQKYSKEVVNHSEADLRRLAAWLRPSAFGALTKRYAKLTVDGNKSLHGDSYLIVRVTVLSNATSFGAVKKIRVETMKWLYCPPLRNVYICTGALGSLIGVLMLWVDGFFSVRCERQTPFLAGETA